MAITGVANLAVKVRDLDEAVAFYRRAGATVTDPEQWRDGRRGIRLEFMEQLEDPA